MRANNSVKARASKYNLKKKNSLGIATPKTNLFVKHLSKNNIYLNTIIIIIGVIISLILLGVTCHFKSLDYRISYIPIMLSFMFVSILSALRYRFKKI
jgi:predicted neutral ceramidase superfamily lipid hydrolase